jgi:hypothetical protein
MRRFLLHLILHLEGILLGSWIGALPAIFSIFVLGDVAVWAGLSSNAAIGILVWLVGPAFWIGAGAYGGWRLMRPDPHEPSGRP